MILDCFSEKVEYTFIKCLKIQSKEIKKCKHVFCNPILLYISLFSVIDNINKKNIDAQFLCIEKYLTFISKDKKYIFTGFDIKIKKHRFIDPHSSEIKEELVHTG